MAKKAKPAPAGPPEPPSKKTAAAVEEPPPVRSGNPWLIYAILAAATVFIFGQAASFGVIGLDDTSFTTDNFVVENGLTLLGLRYAFTSFEMGSWHPLTWISHMLDYSLFGRALGSFHMVNAALHAANCMLLFYLLRRMTLAHWRSAIVAILFAVHPMHVEPVVWLADRKGLLATLFWLAAIYAWWRYTYGSERRWYAWSLAAFAAALLAKPTAVTFPLVLILLDFWPLRRVESLHGVQNRIVEKLPFFALSAALAVVTFIGQRQSGAMDLYGNLPLSRRLVNALYALGMYLWKTIVPKDLIVNPVVKEHYPIIILIGAAFLLVGVTALAVKLLSSRPWVATGWFWFLFVLVPTLGFVQTGDQAWADRYAYLPHIGLFVLLVWGLHDLIPEGVRESGGFRAALITAAVAFAYGANVQAGHWADPETFYDRTVRIEPDHVQARQLLARTLMRDKKFAEADTHLRKAIELRPAWADSYRVLSESQYLQEKPEESLATIDNAIRLDPQSPIAHYNRGIVLRKLNRGREAIQSYQKAIDIGLLPDKRLEAYFEMGRVAMGSGANEEALGYFKKALEVDPFHYLARKNLGYVYFRLRLWAEAQHEFEVLFKVNQNDEDVIRSLSFLRARK